ncbi:hypothetical protein ALC60_12785 [Trachymyrmex zeteki]|uniref:Uncharacterized protein n=1 Tax=Mycetomoellerius zeteki TaxID=64791 RepID=A0A151WK13_9HYME|nr:hypothetical protein ALC60_12785 [Trachymyrmex zeteki]
MQLDVECKMTPMADAMLLQLLKGQQMKLDASFTKALVKQPIAIVYIAQRVEVSLSELDIRSGSIKTFFFDG